jgi:hypothetical protein
VSRIAILKSLDGAQKDATVFLKRTARTTVVLATATFALAVATIILVVITYLDLVLR